MNKHQYKERIETRREAAAKYGQPANQVTEREEFLRGEIPICKLIAKKHPNNRGHRKRIENERLLPWSKS